MADDFRQTPPNPQQLPEPFTLENFERVRHNLQLLIQILRSGFRDDENSKGLFYTLGTSRFTIANSNKKLQTRQIRAYQQHWLDAESQLITIGVLELAGYILPLIYNNKILLQVKDTDEWMKLIMRLAGAGNSFANGRPLDTVMTDLATDLAKPKLEINVASVASLLAMGGITSSTSVFAVAFEVAYCLILVGGSPEYIETLYGMILKNYWHDMVYSGVLAGYQETYQIGEDNDGKLTASAVYIRSKVTQLRAAVDRVRSSEEYLLYKLMSGFHPDFRQDWINYYAGQVVLIPGSESFVLQEIKNLEAWLNRQKET